MRKELSKKEVDGLSKKIQDQYGFKINPNLRYFAKDEKEGMKIFLYSGSEIPEIPIEWVGLHFGTQVEDKFQPSIDGAQLMNAASKNILQVSRQEVEEIMKGNEIKYDGECSGVIILKSGDFASIGMAGGGRITSMVSKSRRI